MGSVNPVFLLPGALAERAPQIAAGYIQSVTMGVGQFCTNPGMVLGVANDGLAKFLDSTVAAAAQVAPATMLHPGIHAAFEAGRARLASIPGVEPVAASDATAGCRAARSCRSDLRRGRGLAPRP